MSSPPLACQSKTRQEMITRRVSTTNRTLASWASHSSSLLSFMVDLRPCPSTPLWSFLLALLEHFDPLPHKQLPQHRLICGLSHLDLHGEVLPAARVRAHGEFEPEPRSLPDVAAASRAREMHYDPGGDLAHEEFR